MALHNIAPTSFTRCNWQTAFYYYSIFCCLHHWQQQQLDQTERKKELTSPCPQLAPSMSRSKWKPSDSCPIYAKTTTTNWLSALARLLLPPNDCLEWMANYFVPYGNEGGWSKQAKTTTTTTIITIMINNLSADLFLSFSNGIDMHCHVTWSFFVCLCVHMASWRRQASFFISTLRCVVLAFFAFHSFGRIRLPINRKSHWYARRSVSCGNKCCSTNNQSTTFVHWIVQIAANWIGRVQSWPPTNMDTHIYTHIHTEINIIETHRHHPPVHSRHQILQSSMAEQFNCTYTLACGHIAIIFFSFYSSSSLQNWSISSNRHP